MKRRPLLLLILAITIAGVGLWAWDRFSEPLPQEHNSPPKPAEYDLVLLQKQADEACLCQLRSGKEDACWASFNARMAELEAMRVGSSSLPFSREGFTLGDEQQDFVSTGYRLVGADNAPPVCTSEQLKAAEAKFKEVIRPSYENYDEAKEATERLIAVFSTQLADQKTDK